MCVCVCVCVCVRVAKSVIAKSVGSMRMSGLEGSLPSIISERATDLFQFDCHKTASVLLLLVGSWFCFGTFTASGFTRPMTRFSMMHEGLLVLSLRIF